MPRPWRIRYAGAKYHLTARGNAKGAVFLDTSDYERFLDQLQDGLEKDEVVLYAYVLMPNHYHLLVETPLGNVQKFMQRLNTAYGMYFRFKHNRSGHCFQGRYWAKLVEGDDYLVRLTRYVHMNPVKTRRHGRASLGEKKAHLDTYPWSSYRSYVGLEQRKEWVSYRWLELMGRSTVMGRQAAYRKYIEQMLGREDDVLKEGMDRSIYAIGDERFAKQTEEDLKEARFSKVETGDIIWPEKTKRPLEQVIEPVLEEVGLAADELRGHGRVTGDKKMIAIELLCRLSSASQRSISPFCGYKREATVGRQRKALRSRIREDAGFAKRLKTMEKKLKRRLNAS